MSQYINNIGLALAEVFERAASSQPAQFCGYWANLNFWLAELQHLLAVIDGYEERLRRMQEAYDRYIEQEGGPHDLDDVYKPYQGARATTSRGERRRLVGRARSAFERMAQRALEMGLIDLDQYDGLAERLKMAEVGAPLDRGPASGSGESRFFGGPPPVS